MHSVHLAVLMTSHNRRTRTLSALAALHAQRGLPAHATLGVHLVDAGSTDGTPEAVRLLHPSVEVMSVGVDIPRNQALRIASRNSRSGGGGGGSHRGRPGGPSHRWTHQLWLDDGVELFPDALTGLLGAADAVGDGSVIVGAVRGPDGTTVYSGRRGRSLTLVEPGGERPEPCDTYDGRVVLLSRAAHDLVGDPDKVFRHRMGDYDHGFRARRAGVDAFVAPSPVGVCAEGPDAPGSLEPGIGVREALRRVTSVRELPPRQWWVYCLRHTWPWAPLLMVSPYARTAARATIGRWRG
ncbi:glycosyltransferase family 2 protein [Streptomyces bacillaris]|uniref:glycosyltransferase family 2 protein n=1 Tax=Streptomyces bacillaris TaxID=68179 RepID=UPI00381D0F17